MAHSLEIRTRAVDAYLDGAGSYEYVAKLLQVGSASLKRWVWRTNDTGRVEPARHGGGVEPVIDDRGLKWLRMTLAAKNDLTLEELRCRYNRRFREAVSTSTMGRAVRERLAWPRKKRRTGPRSETRRQPSN